MQNVCSRQVSNISIHSAGVVGCSSKRVLVLHVLPLAVCTAFWSGRATIILKYLYLSGYYIS